MKTARDWIAELELEPHPEGGWFREHYRASGLIETPSGPRNASTAIYYLLEGHDVSRFHRLKLSDELWHFYAGFSLIIPQLHPNGEAGEERIGPEGPFSVVVPSGTWFGARLAESDTPGAYALVGCTVAPGFDFADFELADAEQLLAQFPEAATHIEAQSRA